MIISVLLVGFGNQSFAQNDQKLVVLETNLGEIVIEFFPEVAPNHVENFIGLTESGFYDGTLFHRIIPGFMIQGGDPNTIEGDPSTWGIGGPAERINAEFNNIKHNRGIVSMARSADPDSGGSQFFIVHKDSNFLDEQYTVFGRIVTDESFETLDKIASVETGTNDIPLNPEQVKITKAMIVDRSEITNIINLSKPEQIQSNTSPFTGNQKYESTKHGVKFSVPEGWMLQEPEKTTEDSPDVVAVGPKIGLLNPVFSLTVEDTDGKTFDELIFNKNEELKKIVEQGTLNILRQEKTNINNHEAYLTNAQGFFSSEGDEFDVYFSEVMIYDSEKVYRLTYSNDADDFESQITKFEETINSFEIMSESNDEIIPLSETSQENSEDSEGGGCLIATATFGSELAPQVQQLRELRDNTILSTESGTSFMTGFNQFYYSFSPLIADYERENPVFREAVKLTITPMLASLSILNHVDIDSEEEMMSYGIGIIMMNIGMYFMVPAIVIYSLRSLPFRKLK